MSRRAFTLIELLIATALAMALAAAATSAFYQIRSMVQRREALLGLHRAAEMVHQQTMQRTCQLAQHAALVADARTPSAGAPRAGLPTLWLCFLRAREHTNEWGVNMDAQGKDRWRALNTDLTWELWEYRPEERTLYAATNAATRWFNSGTLVRTEGTATQNLQGKNFVNQPRPRRTLAGPDWWRTMDDNRLFPKTGTWDASDASRDDVGDFSDLRRNLIPLLVDVAALDVQLVGHAGALATASAAWAGGSATASTSPAAPWLCPGLRLDGQVRDGASLPPSDAAWNWATTEAVQRPRLLRLRLTLREPVSGVTQVFTFTSKLPALVGTP